MIESACRAGLKTQAHRNRRALHLKDKTQSRRAQGQTRRETDTIDGSLRQPLPSPEPSQEMREMAESLHPRERERRTGQRDPCLHVESVSGDRAQVPERGPDWLIGLATARGRPIAGATRLGPGACAVIARIPPVHPIPRRPPAALAPLAADARPSGARTPAAIKHGGPPADRPPSSSPRSPSGTAASTSTSTSIPATSPALPSLARLDIQGRGTTLPM